MSFSTSPLHSEDMTSSSMCSWRHLISLAEPCWIPGQSWFNSFVQAFFIGNLKSISSAILTSASNKVARHSYPKSSLCSWRHLMTLAEPYKFTQEFSGKAAESIRNKHRESFGAKIEPSIRRTWNRHFPQQKSLVVGENYRGKIVRLQDKWSKKRFVDIKSDKIEAKAGEGAGIVK